MSEFYHICTSICVIAAIACLIGLVITFDPIGYVITLVKKKTPARRIRKARKTIERYNVSEVLTENERKAIVLEYLEDAVLIVTRWACCDVGGVTNDQEAQV